MMNHLWSIIILVFSSATLCMIANNLLFHSINNTIAELKEKIKPQLLLLNEPDKARFIGVEQLPLLQTWHNESINYGVINIMAMVSAITLVLCVGVYGVLPLLVAILNLLFMLANIISLPSTIGRKFRVDRIMFNYQAMVKLLAIVDNEKNKPEPVVDP